MIVATAGHVNHGKTALVRALTGVDADRLPEEKRRSMTIDLGFAYCGSLGFVDVPGHERFLHNMLAGVSGVDLALLVVAADDGPMPQTHEHLAILRLLRVPRLVVAVTKIDRVERARVREVAQALQALVGPVRAFPVSSATGEGVGALGCFLEECASKTRTRGTRGNFRLGVDRAFILPGAGLVVTGTALSGELATGATVRALLAGTEARVRGIHVHNAPARVARAGLRVALNLAGLDGKAPIRRGDWIVAGAAPEAVQRFDASLSWSGAPVRHGSPVHLHLGAANVLARAFCLRPPFWQLLTQKPLGAVHGDRFILRDASAQRTLGGGSVVDIYPPSRGRARPERLAVLEAMAIDDDEAALAALAERSPAGMDLARFAANRNRPAATGWHFAPRHRRALREAALATLAAWHGRAPGLPCMPEDRVLPALAATARGGLLDELAHEGRVVREPTGVRLANHRAQLGAADAALWARIRLLLERGGLRPPTLAELAREAAVDVRSVEKLLSARAREGELVRVSRNRFFLPGAMQRFEAMVLDMRSVTAAAFRDRTGIGRDLAIEVLEFFDRTRLTRRIGDAHVVAGCREPKSGSPVALP